MPEQALYLKWRPLSFDDVIGQEHITRTLRNSIKTGRIRHAYLFSGPRGTGKTTMARLLAKAVNCLDPDPEKRPCNQCATCVSVNEGREEERSRERYRTLSCPFLRSETRRVSGMTKYTQPAPKEGERERMCSDTE